MVTLEKKQDNKLGNRIEQILQNYEIKQTVLAEKCGMNDSDITRVKAGSEVFEKVLNIARMIGVLTETSHEKELMLLYVQEVKHPSNIKLALDYLDLNGHKKAFVDLCERAEKASNDSNNLTDYTDFYKLNYSRKHDDIDLEFWHQKLTKKKPKTVEMKVFKMLQEMSYFNDSKKYKRISDLIIYTEVMIDEIFKENSKIRLNQLQQSMNVNNTCDFEKAIELAFDAIKEYTGDRILAYYWYTIGMSHSRHENQLSTAMRTN